MNQRITSAVCEILRLFLKDPLHGPMEKADMWGYIVNNQEAYGFFSDVLTYAEITEELIARHADTLGISTGGFDEIVAKISEIVPYLKRVGIDFNIPILGIDPAILKTSSGKISAPKKPRDRKPKRKPKKKDKTRRDRKPKRKPKKKDKTRRGRRSGRKPGKKEEADKTEFRAGSKRAGFDIALRKNTKKGLSDFVNSLKDEMSASKAADAINKAAGLRKEKFTTSDVYNIWYPTQKHAKKEKGKGTGRKTTRGRKPKVEADYVSPFKEGSDIREADEILHREGKGGFFYFVDEFRTGDKKIPFSRITDQINQILKEAGSKVSLKSQNVDQIYRYSSAARERKPGGKSPKKGTGSRFKGRVRKGADNILREKLNISLGEFLKKRKKEESTYQDMSDEISRLSGGKVVIKASNLSVLASELGITKKRGPGKKPAQKPGGGRKGNRPKKTLSRKMQIADKAFAKYDGLGKYIMAREDVMSPGQLLRQISHETKGKIELSDAQLLKIIQSDGSRKVIGEILAD